MSRMIVKPVISEKTIMQTSAQKFVFEVPMRANKIEIARAIATDFRVTVLDVNISVRKGKVKSLSGIKGRRANTKQAIVTLKKGDKIAAFELEEAK